jgi:hypothetical protein
VSRTGESGDSLASILHSTTHKGNTPVKSAALIAIALAVSAFAQLTDMTVRTPPPAVARTAGQWYRDPTFGTRMIRVTDESWAAGRCNIGSAYGFYPTFNADSTRALISCETGSGSKDYIVSFAPDASPSFTVTDSTTTRWNGARNGNAWWHRSNPDLLYFFNYGATLSAYNAATKTVTPVHTYGEIGPDYVTDHFIMANDSNRWGATLVHKSSGPVGCIVGQISPPAILHAVNDGMDGECQLDRAGLWIARAISGKTECIRISDGSTLPCGAGHRDVGPGALLYGYWYDVPTIRKWQFGAFSPLTLYTGLMADDYSWLATDPTWAVLSHSGSSGCGMFAGCKEIYSIRTDSTPGVIRWAHHQSAYDGSYMDEAYASQSYDGRFIAFQSNSGKRITDGGRTDVYVIDARPPAPPVVEPVKPKKKKWWQLVVTINDDGAPVIEAVPMP